MEGFHRDSHIFCACGMQVEYICICSTHEGASISVDSALAMQALCIESGSYSSIYTMFVLGIINVVMNLQ